MVPKEMKEALFCWSTEPWYQQRNPTQKQSISSWKMSLKKGLWLGY